MNRVYQLLFSFLLVAGLSAQAPQWVMSYGVENHLGEDYLTGFGMSAVESSNSQAMDEAQTQAANDLIRQIRVNISTELVDQARGNEEQSSSYFTSVTTSSAQMELSGLDFEMYSQGWNRYALAYIRRSDLVAQIQDQCLDRLRRIEQIGVSAMELSMEGKHSQAAGQYAQVLALFPELYRDFALLRILEGGSDEEVFRRYGRNEFSTLDTLIAHEQNVIQQLDTQRSSREFNLDQALDKVLFLLSEQGVQGGRLQNPPLTYEQTDFSSPFGRFAAEKLEQVLEGGLPRGGEETVVMGSYWLRDDQVELLVQARRTRDGQVIGSASAQFPRSSLASSMILEPSNHLDALTDLLEFQEEALTDGSIHLDIWTDQGHNEDVLVYSQGDELQLYFRVNQPCFLQLTYFLATGEKVLLEEKFYIGIDKVNRVVALPYTFEVVPPFGVERMVVTAFSTEPPEPQVYPQVIEGERYMVFGSMTDVVSQSRGLRRNDATPEVRSGEAQLAITTLP